MHFPTSAGPAQGARLHVGLPLLAWMVLMAPELVLAQGARISPASMTREQSRDFVDDLSRSLGETDRDFFGSRSRGRQPLSAQPLTRPTPEMERLRPLLNDALDGVQNLAYDLPRETDHSPGIRSLMANVVKLRAQLTRVAEVAREENDHRVLLDDLKQLDAEWRDTSYRLQGVRTLSREVRQQLAALDQLATQMTDMLKLKPQVNRNDLLERTASLRSDLDHLLEDIEYELSGEEARRFTQDGRRVQQQIRSLIQLVQAEEDQSVIVDEFRRFQSMWYPQAAKLQSLENRTLDRSLRRITQSDTEIHKLLLLPQQLDKEQLLYMAATLKRDIDTFFERTPLKLLVNLPRGNTVLATAGEFYGVCENYVDVINRSGDIAQIEDAFHYIEQGERNFVSTFRAIDSDEALQVLKQIDATISTMRSALNLQRSDFNRSGAAELAAAVDALSEQLNQSTRRWLTQDRQNFSAQALREADAFAEGCRDLHDAVVTNVPVAQLRTKVEDTYETWRRLYNYLVKCQTEDRPGLGRLSARITPSLVELRTMLAQ